LQVFTFGYDGSLLNGLQTLPQWQKFFNHPVKYDLGLISASFYLRESALGKSNIGSPKLTSLSLPAKLVTPFIASFLAERFGRRTALLIGSVISVGLHPQQFPK
jgi:MFS family permease